MELAALLKPAPFVVKETGDPELLQDFKEYMKIFKKFLLATKVVGEHTANCKDCGACVFVILSFKILLILVIVLVYLILYVVFIYFCGV